MRFELIIICIVFYAVSAFSESDEKAVQKFGQDIRALEEKSTELSPEQIVSETEGILDRLEENSSDENRPLVEAIKNETSKFYKELVDYNTFLNKITDPSFFNFEKAVDISELNRQAALASEYKIKSDLLLKYAETFPQKLKTALERKQFSRSTIQSVLNGMAEAEAGRKDTPANVLSLRVQHAAILKQGLNWLIEKHGKWRYDTNQGLLGFDDAELSIYWEKQIIEPLIQVENKINEVVLAPEQIKTSDQ